MDKPTKFYRYVAVSYAVIDEYGDFASAMFPDPKIEIREYFLHRETDKGYWIGIWPASRQNKPDKWVSKTARKRYAYPTKKEALNSFIARTQRRLNILESQIEFSKSVLCRAKNIQLTKQKQHNG